MKISCSWCHHLNDAAPSRFCANCGHEIGVARSRCACPNCQSGFQWVPAPDELRSDPTPHDQPEPGDAATEDRFLSLEFLAYDLEQIAQTAREGDEAAMREAIAKLRKWRADFELRFREVETAVGDFATLDALLGGEQ